MDASATAIQTFTPKITESVITGNIDFWIKLVSVFSTAFAVFIAVIAIIFAILTWSHFKQREKAEKELEKLTKIREDSEILHGVIKKLADRAADQIIEIREMLKTTEKLSKKQQKELEEKSKSLDRTLNSLTTLSSLSPSESRSPSVSPSAPGDVRTEAKNDLFQKAVRERIRKLSGQPETNRDDVAAALEILLGEKKSRNYT